MKILVHCPGKFTDGLDSPERGEGRWAQQYAKMLAKAGHDVWASSGWRPGSITTHYGVNLINQAHMRDYGPFDLYIDSAWWDKKAPDVEAKVCIALKWAPEDYLRHSSLPDNFYVGYPYVSHHYNFSGPKFTNQNRAFAMPAMFCDEFKRPNWDRSKIFLPGKIDTNRPYQKYMDAIAKVLDKYPVEGRSRRFFQDNFGSAIDFKKPHSVWAESTPYNQVIEALGRSKISMPILNPGCIIEAACHGVPSLFWEHGGFFNPLAQQLNIQIEHDAPPERILEVTDLLMTNKKKYHEVVYASQDYFSAHTQAGSLKYFNLMMETIGL